MTILGCRGVHRLCCHTKLAQRDAPRSIPSSSRPCSRRPTLDANYATSPPQLLRCLLAVSRRGLGRRFAIRGGRCNVFCVFDGEGCYAVSLDKLKKLSIRLADEQSALANALAVAPPRKALSRELLQQLAELSIALTAVAREIDVRAPRSGWG
jgi:hypothetical protein